MEGSENVLKGKTMPFFFPFYLTSVKNIDAMAGTGVAMLRYEKKRASDPNDQRTLIVILY